MATNGTATKLLWWLLGTVTAVAMAGITLYTSSLQADVNCMQTDVVDLQKRVVVGETQRATMIDDLKEIKQDVKTLLLRLRGNVP